MSGLVGVPPISVLPSECLFGRFQFDYGVLVLRCNCGDVCGLKLKYTSLCVLAESDGGTSRNMNSFYCRSPIKPRAA